MARKYPEGFYVYLHIRKSDGLVFYVGKGHNRRAWDICDCSRLNKYWQRTKSKHGIEVKIYKDGMSNDCALTLEKIIIAKYRTLGHPLTNMTDGGDGFVGVDDELRIDNMINVMGKPVVSSLGERFDTVSSASRWLSENGYPNASPSGVSSCARGSRNFAYERAWSFGSNTPKHPDVVDAITFAKNTIAKPVIRSDGVVYESAHLAAREMARQTHPKASSSSIRKACIGVLKTAYGYKWKYENE